MLTREQIEQVRKLIDGMHPEAKDWNAQVEALAILDSELSLPEEREWGVRRLLAPGAGRCIAIAAESDARTMCLERPDCFSLISRTAESRTPAGKWEAAK